MDILQALEKELSLMDIIYFILCFGVCGIVLLNGWEPLVTLLTSGPR